MEVGTHGASLMDQGIVLTIPSRYNALGNVQFTYRCLEPPSIARVYFDITDNTLAQI
jgi:hypothetical protein